ncbi:UNKNOWN [Stylonychia lemnae]|uniref:Uncharacterized protein n=1 Tax=Stylonychia lemnae TaxID=5949 RepID=A0A078AXU3_STYLE|nr:UNKNOWN [Stylonychia lemnae]|eukprot:CDW86057.1 UNKNOWN [Stylonychia lemnae]
MCQRDNIDAILDNYDDEMFEREEDTATQEMPNIQNKKASERSVHSSQSQKSGKKSNGTRGVQSNQDSLILRDKSQRENKDQYALPGDDEEADEDYYDQNANNQQMQQQSQQVSNSHTNDRSQVIHQEPQPIRDNFQNRPMTEQNAHQNQEYMTEQFQLNNSSNGAGNMIEYQGSNNKSIIKANTSGGIVDLKASTFSQSNQRPTTQGVIGYNVVPAFNNSMNTYQNNGIAYEDFRANSNPNINNLNSFNRKHSDKPPINLNSNKNSQIQSDKDYQAQDGPFHGDVKTLNTSSPLKNFVQRENSTGANVLQINRKKIRELLYGGSASRVNGYNNQQSMTNYLEKEQLQNERRNLKLQMNSMKDENLRLKTKLQSNIQEMTKKDKDIEILTMKLQQQQLGQSQQTSYKAEGNIFESFLVSQLKRQNRDLKQELESKDLTLEKLRRDLKLSKSAEIEVEMQQYIDECMRLRNLLENYMMNPSMFSTSQLQAQQQMTQQQNQVQVDQQVIDQYNQLQNVLFEKTNLLQREMDLRNQIQLQLMSEKEMREKNERKWDLQEQKIKKFNQITEENKRKQKIISDKQAEVSRLKEEVELYREKAKERDQIYNKNKELVTKQYSYQSSIDYKDKKIHDQSQQISQLQDEIRKLQKQRQNNSPERKVTEKMLTLGGGGGTDQKQLTYSGQKSEVKIDKTVLTKNQLNYTPNQVEIIFRAIKGQALTTIKDAMGFKNYYNSHKDDIHKEIEFIQKLDIQQQIVNHLHLNSDNYLSELKSAPMKYNVFTDLERFVENRLNIQEKDQKKFVIFHLIYSNSPSINEVNYQGLVDLIQNMNNAGNETPASVKGSNNQTPPQLQQQLSSDQSRASNKYAKAQSQAQTHQEYETSQIIDQHQQQQYSSKTQVLQKKSTEQLNIQEQEEEYEAESTEKVQVEVVNDKIQSDRNQITNRSQLSQKSQKSQISNKLIQQNSKPMTNRESILEEKKQGVDHSAKPSDDLNEQQAPSTVRVNENIQESNAQFNPPQMPSDTKVSKHAEKAKQDQDDYEQDDFEDATEQNNSNLKEPNSQNVSGNQMNINQNQYENDVQNASANEEQEVSIQITEDQMLDIAEQVFQTLADSLKSQNMTVKQAFGEYIQVIDQLEDEKDVLVIAGGDFLMVLQSIIGGDGLSILETSCLMRVLSKQEKDHSFNCIVVSELQLVLENFGITSNNVTSNQDVSGINQSMINDQSKDQSLPPNQQQNTTNTKKLTKKNFIKDAVWRGMTKNVGQNDGGELIYQVFREIIKRFDDNTQQMLAIIKQGSYEQLVKSKKKELKLDLIKREDLLAILENQTQLALSDDQNIQEALSILLQIDAKYPDVLQYKLIQTLVKEVSGRMQKEEEEQKTLQEFYQPQGEDSENEEGGESKGRKAEVLNFDQLINEDDDEEYNHYLDQDEKKAAAAGKLQIQSKALGPIAEDQINEDTQSPVKH